MLEDLTKNQIVLLTLLVSFVTSIATGIITFSLLQQAPPVVTQTINRVVERTIEQVSEVTTGQTVREVTVVVKEEDQVVDSVSKNSHSVVRIEQAGSIVGLGVFVAPGGLVMTPAKGAVGSRIRTSGILFDQTEVSLEYLGQDEGEDVMFFKVIPQEGESFSAQTVVLADEHAQLGQTLVAIGGTETNIISIGRVSALTYSDPKDISTENGFETETALKGATFGIPVFNLSGELIGLRSGRFAASGQPIYLFVSSLMPAVAEYSAL
jgi:S1-C subfamily serine protease